MRSAKASPRTLAQKHLWLSWFWGLGLAMGLRSIWALVTAVQESGKGWYSVFANSDWFLLTAMNSLSVVIALGLPSLLGAFVRRRGMGWAFITAVSPVSLVWRTVLVTECSVLLLLMIYLVLPFAVERGHYRKDTFLITYLFFGLSLPWLLSSVLAALRLWPGRMPEPTPEICATRTTSDS